MGNGARTIMRRTAEKNCGGCATGDSDCTVGHITPVPHIIYDETGTQPWLFCLLLLSPVAMKDTCCPSFCALIFLVVTELLIVNT